MIDQVSKEGLQEGEVSDKTLSYQLTEDLIQKNEKALGEIIAG